ncbi:MAG: ATP-dependent DNA helicase RecG [Lachnospiraceae bacterium]|nr:ATP-dependent DNA helicase RecG [Lachnospiraceae bacterium]
MGEKNAALFARLGIESVYDLISYYPRAYKKLPALCKVCELKEGEVCAVKLKVSDDLYFKKTASNAVTSVTGFDSTGKVLMTFFRVTYLRSMLKTGSEWVFMGVVKRKGRNFAFEMPEIHKTYEYIENLKNLQPVYHLTKGINSKSIAKYVTGSINELGPFEDKLDPEIIKKFGFPSLSRALSDIHFPINEEDYIFARNRLAFEEFYDFFIQLNEIKKNYNRLKSEYVFLETAEYERFKSIIPFELTAGQNNALNDIVSDLTGGFVMNRLIQGDVGCGKTIVAFLAALLCASNGYQCAFMAPTEVLAAQHFTKFKDLIERYKLNLNISYLSGSTTQTARKEILNDLSLGSINLIVGTHALIEDNVEFENLALVITDEQHRFGVLQRNILSDKGNKPHILSLSATPIPRTLASVYYTDLQVSLIKDKPSCRIPIKTGLRSSQNRVEGLRFLYSKVKLGQQAIVVCPMIEENEDTNLSNVTDYAKYLKELMPDDIKIGVLHGRMKNNEKNRIMQYFANNDINILVSTTVIEVGIDVPNATVILIENAERFGLATLHQLRGRVGRGSLESYCILINGSGKEEENDRLNVMLESEDGFYIADEDLRLRGPGDLTGIRQSGDMHFKIADMYRDRELFVKAKEYADKKYL